MPLKLSFLLEAHTTVNSFFSNEAYKRQIQLTDDLKAGNERLRKRKKYQVSHNNNSLGDYYFLEAVNRVDI